MFGWHLHQIEHPCSSCGERRASKSCFLGVGCSERQPGFHTGLVAKNVGAAPSIDGAAAINMLDRSQSARFSPHSPLAQLGVHMGLSVPALASKINNLA